MSLYRERLAAFHDGADELVLLHGWASSSDCWRSALPLLRRHFNVTLVDLPGHGLSRTAMSSNVDAFLEILLAQLPARAIYLGWSLGGMLATAVAARFPERVTALICVASNACFVQTENWPEAMAPHQFEDFAGRFERDTSKALRRFAALQWQGDDNSERGGSRLPAPVVTDADTARRLLGWLQTLDNRAALEALSCPALSLFGERDALVPVAAAARMQALQPALTTRVFAGAGHLPFASQPEAFWVAVLDFCRDHQLLRASEKGGLSKRDIAASFSRAAGSYDSVAELQRRVADRLFTALAPAGKPRILDLGSGTGYSLPALRQHAGQLYALDLAEGMLRHARQQPGRDADGWLCGDAEDLPLTDASLDAVFSSLSVQWCENLAAVFAEAYRVLQPGGRMLLSTLGPQTLKELRAAWGAVDDRAHVNRFADAAELEAAIAGSGLTLTAWEEDEEVLYYRELKELMAELKQLGAHNVNRGRPGGLTGKQALRRFIAAYEQFRGRDGRLPASYQVWYLQLEKPATETQVQQRYA